MEENSVNYFLGANSRYGFYSLYDGLTDPGLGESRLIIKAGPGGGKSTYMKRLAADIASSGEPVEYIWCSGDPDSLDGIRVPRFGVAVVDGTAPHAAVTQPCVHAPEQRRVHDRLVIVLYRDPVLFRDVRDPM